MSDKCKYWIPKPNNTVCNNGNKENFIPLYSADEIDRLIQEATSEHIANILLNPNTKEVEFKYADGSIHTLLDFSDLIIQEKLVMNAVVVDNVLPTMFTNGTTELFLDISNMDSDVDLTSWLPTNLAKGARIRIRKIDNSPYKITFTDNVLTYRFIDKKGEYIDLNWDGNSLNI